MEKADVQIASLKGGYVPTADPRRMKVSGTFGQETTLDHKDRV